MAGLADTTAHLSTRRHALTSIFDAWGNAELTARQRAEIIESYFYDANGGSPKQVGNASVLVKARRTSTQLPSVLVLGRHQTEDLATRRLRTPASGHVGPGLASRLGSTLAFCEGVQSASSLIGEEPINITYLSVGDGDTYAGAVSQLFTGSFDAVVLTDALHWADDAPILTVGCRGQVLAEITLSAGADIADYGVSGALRNPLTKMVQLIAALRDDRGRVVLDGFYERANRPDPDVIASLPTNAVSGDEWTESVPIAAFGGKRSGLERATMWPGISLLSIETSAADRVTAPGAVRATIAIYLVPNQRHAEVERSLRSWLLANAPADLDPQIQILESARPFRADPMSLPVQAQRTAMQQLFGRDPSLAPAGGASGTGEVAYSFEIPVAYAGLAAPGESIGTMTEHLSWPAFEQCARRAAQTALAMRPE